MKTKWSFIIGCLLFIPALGFAQTRDCCPDKVSTPTVTKGYYSIGNNANKLARKTPQVCCEHAAAAAKAPTVQKGYYAIGNNNQQLTKITAAARGTTAAPTVTKGYYAIGNNNAKLATPSVVKACCDCDCH